ncbi:MAG: dihydrodipicolinate synthase family protein [Firmicutes bacterium]|nr:dihydrodipicolinate synthase family protein [Bacillota bacterium]
MALEYTKAEAKQWAKEKFIGLEAPIFPSFSPDLSELDEDGIRYDVNHIIANGMASILIAPEGTGMTMEEIKRFISIVNDEAGGRVHTSLSVLMNTVEENIAIMQHHEKTGGNMAMLGHPVMYDPESVEELYRNYKYMCDATNLALVFYPGRLKLKRWDISGWPMEILPRIADIPNVVAMKVLGGSSSSLPFTLQCFHLVGEQILVADPVPSAWFTTIPNYGQQWAGAAPFYNTQTPEDQRNVKLFNALRNGDMEEAFRIHWQNMPNAEVADAAFANVNYPETGILVAYVDKYAHWCNGGNGGILRQPTGRLYDYQKEAIRAGLRAIGLTPREPEEEFYVGRMNYAKGARLKRY